MKNSTTNYLIKLAYRMLLLGCLFPIAGMNPATSQTAINSGLKFGEGNLNAQEEAMLQNYLENYAALTDLGNGYPPIWDNPAPQDKPHGIIVALEANPRINDIPLDQYDYIGGFYTDDYGELRCGGAGYWPDTAGIVFALQKDNPDTPEKDGFSFQETIYFKVFTFSTMKDYDVDEMEFDPDFYGTNKWGSLGLSRFLDMQALEDLDFFIAPSGNPICIGNELTLSAEEFIGTNGNYTFQWSSDPPGFNYNTQFPPPVTPEQSTVFTLVVQDGSFMSEHSLPVQVEEFPIVEAGDDGQVCANESYNLLGEAQFYSTVEWTTSGDGYFDDPYLLNTQYIPGPTDAANGEVNLSLLALPLNPCDLQASDELNLTILALPDVDAGEDIIGCTTEDVEVSAFGNDFSTVEWTTSGSGTFFNPNALTTQYVAAGNDFQNGVSLTICAEAQNPCIASSCDVVHVDYVPGPTAFGMTNSTGCENNFIMVSGIAYNYSTTEWITAGDGTFEDPSLFSTKYYPGTQDTENGGTTVTLNAYPIGNCDIATKNVTINVVNLPDITFAPNSENICVGDEFLQLDATVEHSNSIVWSTNGDGTFSNSHIANPKYFPGPQDEQNGQFELELLAYPLPYCSLSTIEPLLVVYQENPTADAGNDVEICENETYTLADAQAESYDQVLWSGGNGAFSNPNLLNPDYIPSPLDYGTTVTLCITASPINPCDVAADDCMDLTIVRLPEADAGNYAIICEDETYLLDGDVMEESAFMWSTSGDGAFSDIGVEDPVYSPGPQDITNGTVTLTLTAQPNAPCTAIAEDAMQLDIQLAVTASAGTDAVICDNENHALATANAANFETLNWSTTGDGVFSNVNAVQPTYYPGATDIETGEVELTMLTTAVSPCVNGEMDSKTLTIIRTVEADAGANAEICEGDSWQLDGEVLYTQNYSWSSSGDGNFNDSGLSNPIYTPGLQDIANGTVTLTLTAQPNAPCTAIAEDAMQLDIQLAVTASAGTDAVICDNENHTLSTANAANFETLNWSTSGDGVFSNVNAVQPTYYPGATDIETGEVELTIFTTAVSPCTLGVLDSKTLTIIRTVEADAGANAEICEGDSWQLDGEVLYTQNYSWSSSGDGNFNDPGLSNAVYTPGSQDISNGMVTLTLTAQPNAPCTAIAEDAMQLDIQLAVIANAGQDAEICEDDTYQLSGYVENATDFEWQSSGDGNFADVYDLNTIYTPGAFDIASGVVSLNLVAQPTAPCLAAASSTMELAITTLPSADAGADANICEDQTVQLSGVVDNAASSVWSTDGDGTFDNVQLLDPVYTPGASDIQNGSVELSLTASPNSPCLSEASSAVSINIQALPEANAGDDGSVCHDEGYIVIGTVQNHASLFWSTSGDGTFDDISGVVSTYHPGDTDIDNGTVELTLTALPAGPCTVAADDAVTLTINHCQDVTLNSGWSGISSWVDPLDPDPEVMFGKVLDDMDILQSATGVFWPGQNINTMGNWNYLQGYSVKMDANTDLTIAGARSASSSLDLSNGWTMIPVLSECVVDVEGLFDGADLAIVKEIAGWRIYWPEMNINSLGSLEPGKAYNVMMNSQGNINFPECSGTKAEPVGSRESLFEAIGYMPWDYFGTSPITHTIGVPRIAIGQSHINQGDLVGAFDTNGNCYGVTMWEGANTSITLFGDEPVTTAKDGFTDGESISFRVFIANTDEEFELQAVYDVNFPQHDGMFYNNGLSMIKEFKVSATGIGGIKENNIQIYPNPTNGLLNISAAIEGSDQFEVYLLNAGGQVLMTETLTNSGWSSLNIGHNPKGVYYLKIVAGDNVKVEKVVLK